LNLQKTMAVNAPLDALTQHREYSALREYLV